MESGAPHPSGSPGPGWYRDPRGDGLRWWDGERWSDQTRPADAGAVEPASQRLRYALLDRWPYIVGAVAVVAIAVVAVVLLTGGGSDSGSPQEQAATQTVDGFLAAVSSGDQAGCEQFIDSDAPGIKSYLRLTKGVPGQATCGFVGASEGRAPLTVDQVTVQGNQATATLAGSPTVIHLSDAGGEWVIDGIR